MSLKMIINRTFRLKVLLKALKALKALKLKIYNVFRRYKDNILLVI